MHLDSEAGYLDNQLLVKRHRAAWIGFALVNPAPSGSKRQQPTVKTQYRGPIESIRAVVFLKFSPVDISNEIIIVSLLLHIDSSRKQGTRKCLLSYGIKQRYRAGDQKNDHDGGARQEDKRA